MKCCPCFFSALFPDDSGESKIDENWFIFGWIPHDVVGVDVPVHDLEPVQISQTNQETVHVFLRNLFQKFAFLDSKLNSVAVEEKVESETVRNIRSAAKEIANFHNCVLS